MKLGVNIDHIATLRNARGGVEPNLIEAARIALKEDILALTMHLREDRRHIKDEDLYEVKKLGAKINLEMAATQEIQKIALDLIPYSVCLVPEKRQEITTEGGLDVLSQKDYLKEFIKPLKEKGILVSLFIDADIEQIEAAKYVGTDYIELHTGCFANAFEKNDFKNELDKLKKAAKHAQNLDIKVNAGHGLNYDNVYLMKEIDGLCELNIGHSIISKSIFIGLKDAISQMLDLIK
ncbi:MAG: pyridoxine 5'-phosphate synthase [Candidatus Gastranaerophilales bacterium]|nr:pyridoxine 5'-phosphate synthase [Candidatus Gastranaerophilales bacterium]